LVVTARAASEQERERLWVVVTATYAGYARYQERTTRRIPIVLLTPEGRRSHGEPSPRARSSEI
jgi:F420H(2)-dependent quinone reductase